MLSMLDLSNLTHGQQHQIQQLLSTHPRPEPEQHLKHIQRLLDDNPQAEYITEQLIAAATPRLGKDPLNERANPYYALFLKHFELPESPAAEYERKERNAKLDARRTEFTFIEPPTRQAVEVYKAWGDDTPLYAPKHIYDFTDLSYSFTVWRKAHNLPKLLTYKQAVYLMLVLAQSPHYKLKKGFDEVIKKRLKRNSSHLFGVGEVETSFKTKINKVYGTWKFLECLSESENTSNNASVIYRAVCRVCDFEEKVDYRYVALKCHNCRKLSYETRPDNNEAFKEDVKIYLLVDGTMTIDKTRPPESVAVAKFVHHGQIVGWEYYESRAPAHKKREDTEHEDKPKRPILGDLSINPLNVLPDSELHGF